MWKYSRIWMVNFCEVTFFSFKKVIRNPFSNVSNVTPVLIYDLNYKQIDHYTSWVCSKVGRYTGIPIKKDQEFQLPAQIFGAKQREVSTL